jgi:hypothetical protein
MMQLESTRDQSTWHSASAIALRVERIRRSARRSKELQHNNSFNPTRDSVAFMVLPRGASWMLFARAG